jgi:desampylase
VLILPAALRAQLAAEARAAFPEECCGLVEAKRDGDDLHVVALHPSPNLSSVPQSGFEIDPALHLKLQRALRGTGREVAGCYHSHPDGRALPSARDRANGCAEGFTWLIAGVTGEGATEGGSGAAGGGEMTLAAFEGPDFQPVVLGV